MADEGKTSNYYYESPINEREIIRKTIYHWRTYIYIYMNGRNTYIGISLRKQKGLYIFEMDHSESQILALIEAGPGYNKSGKEFTHVIRYLFENPKNIGVKFATIGNTTVARRNHGLDISMLLKLYKNISRLNLDQEVSQALHISLSSLQDASRLEELLQEKQNLRYFFIVMLWDKLYQQENSSLLMKFLNLVRNLNSLRDTFCSWCDQIPADFLKMQVTQFLAIMESLFHKLEPSAGMEESQIMVNLNIENICAFLKILFQSNRREPRILADHFVKKNLSEFFRPIDIFKLHLKKINILNFIRYPFLLDLDFKYKLLQIESIFAQQVNMEKNVKNGLHNLLTGGQVQLDANGNISLEGLAYLHFQINRNNILDDSMEKLGKIKHNLKNPLKIQFMGEEGSDEGGVQKQYFQLVTKEIFNPYLDMFLPKNNSRVYWFNGYSFEPPIRFQFVGMLLGLAIYNSVHLDIRFPRMLYQKLLASEGSEQLSAEQLLEEVNEIQPEVYRTLKQILESHDPLQQLELYFTITLEHFGSQNVQELVEDGREIQLTQDNKTEYIYMYCDYLLNKHIQKQFKAFKKGFDRVVDTDLIKAFRPEELETIICGNEVIDFDELESSTHYEGGYTKDTPVVRNLWALLKSLSLEDKKAFLVFCTGSDRVPLDGLKSLNFVVQKHANPEHLPTAHTCFNVFLLPEYETKEKLRKNIEFIIKNNQGFGLI